MNADVGESFYPSMNGHILRCTLCTITGFGLEGVGLRSGVPGIDVLEQLVVIVSSENLGSKEGRTEHGANVAQAVISRRLKPYWICSWTLS